MMWLSPLAWLGVAGIVLPIAIHLLGRGHARVHRFPTLRFLDASKLLPTRRTRIHDPLLLAVRCAILALAAAALAQPVWLTANRRRTLDRGLARAIIVDTSASMRRVVTEGTFATDSARRLLAELTSGAAATTTIQTAHPASALGPAVAWLQAQGRMSEVAIVSDFQHGTLDSAAVAQIPDGIGLNLLLIPVKRDSVATTTSAVEGTTVVARAHVAGDRLDAEWSRGVPSGSAGVTLHGADADRALLAATETAARVSPTPLPRDTARRVAIAFPGYAGAPTLKASLAPPSAPWMTALLASAKRADVALDGAGEATLNGTRVFVLFVKTRPGTIDAARFVALADSATSDAAPLSELEPDVIPDATLSGWRRPASSDPRTRRQVPDGNGPSDGRWLWVAVLALLAAEWYLRRTVAQPVEQQPEARARAA